MRYGYSHTQSGQLVSIINLISGVIAPFFGLLIDKKGYHVVMLILAQILLIFTFAVMIMMPESTSLDASYRGVLPMVFLGVIYSIYAPAAWPLVCLYVKPSMSGSAYGLALALQNTGLAIVPSIVGALTFENRGVEKYVIPLIFLGSFAAVSLALSLYLYAIDDLQTKSKLSKEELIDGKSLFLLLIGILLVSCSSKIIIC